MYRFITDASAKKKKFTFVQVSLYLPRKKRGKFLNQKQSFFDR